MITIFSLPKSFTGHTGVIQRNAITSWTKLEPKCEIILIGDDDGTAEMAAELGVRHVPKVKKNEHGTPLFSDWFEVAQAAASYEVLCGINADVILLNDFPKAVQTALPQMAGGPFLFLCLGWNMVLEELWDFSDKHWDANLRKYAEKTCTQDRPSGYGIWVFPRGLIHDMQPFAIGRLAVGSWLIYDLLSKNVPVVDLTAAATSIHQFHDYGIHHHLLGDIAAKTTNLEPMEMYRVISQSPESKRNIELAGGENKFFPPAHVTWVLTPDGKLVRPALLRRLHYRFYSYRIPGTSWKPFKPIMGPLKYPVRFMRRLRRNRFVK